MVPPSLMVTWAPLVSKHNAANGWSVALLRFTVDKFDGEASDYVWAPAACAQVGQHRSKPPPSPPYPLSIDPDHNKQRRKLLERTSIDGSSERTRNYAGVNAKTKRPTWRTKGRNVANLPGLEDSSVCHAYPDTGTSLIGVPNTAWVRAPITLIPYRLAMHLAMKRPLISR